MNNQLFFKQALTGTLKPPHTKSTSHTSTSSSILSSPWLSIEDPITDDPDKGLYHLSLVREIKATTFMTLTQNLKLNEDSVSSITNLYNNITNALAATTNSIITFPSIETLTATYKFSQDLLPADIHHLHSICKRNYGTLSLTLSTFLSTSFFFWNQCSIIEMYYDNKYDIR